MSLKQIYLNGNAPLNNFSNICCKTNVNNLSKIYCQLHDSAKHFLLL